MVEEFPDVYDVVTDNPQDHPPMLVEVIQPEECKLEAADLISQLRKSKKLHDQFAQQFKTQYRIGGKLTSEWKQHFRVKLPPDMNTQTCQTADARLVELHQEASFLKAEAEARLSAYQSANDEKYRAKYAGLVAEYKEKGQKLPAKDTLAALAEHSMNDIKNALVHAEIELAFWKEILNDLGNCRKIIENVTINLSVEAKALQHEKLLDKLNSRNHNDY